MDDTQIEILQLKGMLPMNRTWILTDDPSNYCDEGHYDCDGNHPEPTEETDETRHQKAP